MGYFCGGSWFVLYLGFILILVYVIIFFIDVMKFFVFEVIWMLYCEFFNVLVVNVKDIFVKVEIKWKMF